MAPTTSYISSEAPVAAEPSLYLLENMMCSAHWYDSIYISGSAWFNPTFLPLGTLGGNFLFSLDVMTGSLPLYMFSIEVPALNERGQDRGISTKVFPAAQDPGIGTRRDRLDHLEWARLRAVMFFWAQDARLRSRIGLGNTFRNKPASVLICPDDRAAVVFLTSNLTVGVAPLPMAGGPVGFAVGYFGTDHPVVAEGTPTALVVGRHVPGTCASSSAGHDWHSAMQSRRPAFPRNGSGTIAIAPPDVLVSHAIWQVPVGAIELPAPKLYAPDALVRGKPRAASFLQPGQGVLVEDPAFISPVYAPVTVQGANGAAYQILAFVDSGADHSSVTPALASLCGAAVQPTGGVVLLAASSAAPVPRETATSAFRFWLGQFSVEFVHIDVFSADPDVAPHMTIGRDLMQAFGFTIFGIPAAQPQAADFEAEPFIDMNDDVQRVSDANDEGLTHQELVDREGVRARTQILLDAHAEAVPINSFINYPGSLVPIMHEENAPQPKPISYGKKSGKAHLDTYIDAQVNLWQANGKIKLWDIEQHGAFPRHCMPLLPAVTVGPDGSLKKVRVCCDARYLNVGMVDDRTPIPRTDMVYEALANHRFLAEFDGVSFFNQFEINPEHQHKVAIRWNDQVYVWVGAPFGLKFLSSFVQNIMQQVFSDMPFVRIFVDNILVASDTLEEHEEHCAMVIARCTKYNIKLDAGKPKVACTKMRTLGNMVTKDGVSADPDKVAAILKWPAPTGPKDVQRFLGLANYLRHMIRHFSSMAAPLEALRSVKPHQFRWTKEAEKSFDLLKHAVAHLPSLKFADFSKRFAITIDASATGIGACLFQPVNQGDLPNADNIITFASRSLLDYETRYSPYVLELNGLVYALKYFDDFLYGRPFDVYTDCASLSYLNKQSQLNRTLRNWMALICQYDFEIYHISGQINVIADALSRMYPGKWGCAPTQPARPPPVYSFAMLRSGARRVHFSDPLVKGPAPTKPRDAPPQLQSGAPAAPVQEEIAPSGVQEEVQGSALGLGAARSLPRVETSTRTRQPSSPDERRAVVEHAHHGEGHFGVRAVHASLARSGYRFEGMSDLIREVCEKCETCQRWKHTTRQPYHPRRPATGAIPFDVLQFDLATGWESTPSAEGFTDILVVTDVFSGFTLLRGLRGKTAVNIARCLWLIFCDFGPAREVQSDNAKEQLAPVVQAIMEDLSIKHRTSLTYSPHSNGKAESHVAICVTTMRKLMAETGLDWGELLPLVQLHMNLKHQYLTNSSPFALVFARQANSFVAYHNDNIFPPRSSEDVAAWQLHTLELHKKIFPDIRVRSAALQAKYLKYSQPSFVATENLPIGAVVYLKSFVRGSKSNSPWEGPFTIARVNGLGRSYTLRDFVGNVYGQDVGREALRVVESTETKALVPSYRPEAILDSRHVAGPKPTSRGREEFLVKWFGHSDPTWVTLKQLPDPDMARRFKAELRVLPPPPRGAAATIAELRAAADAPSRRTSPNRGRSPRPKSLSSTSAAAASRSPSVPRRARIPLPPAVSAFNHRAVSPSSSDSDGARSRSPSQRLRDFVPR